MRSIFLLISLVCQFALTGEFSHDEFKQMAKEAIEVGAYGVFSTDETAIDGLTLDVVCLMIEFFERIVRNIKEDENKTNLVLKTLKQIIPRGLPGSENIKFDQFDNLIRHKYSGLSVSQFREEALKHFQVELDLDKNINKIKELNIEDIPNYLPGVIRSILKKEFFVKMVEFWNIASLIPQDPEKNKAVCIIQ